MTKNLFLWLTIVLILSVVFSNLGRAALLVKKWLHQFHQAVESGDVQQVKFDETTITGVDKNQSASQP